MSGLPATLIDYGAGNLRSVERALTAAGFAVARTQDPAEAARAAVLVLPGQGHFRQVMTAFLASGFEGVVRRHLAAEKPFLGICVGLQLLMEASEEAPGMPGLGVLPGTVRRFDDRRASVPQMGWNTLRPVGDPPLFAGLPQHPFAYFANSYYADFDEDMPGAVSDYAGVTFQSAYVRGRLWATQFHPEKSQVVGLRILENFRRIAEAQGTPA